MTCDMISPVRDNSGVEEDIWLPKLVEARLVEGARIMVFTAGRVGPRGYGSSLPNELMEAMRAEIEPMLDENGNALPWWTRAAEEGRLRRRPVTARRMTLAEQAMRWPVRYLADWDGPRRVLMAYLGCKAVKWPFDKECSSRGWSRATAYRAKDKALGLIASGLTQDRVRVE